MSKKIIGKINHSACKKYKEEIEATREILEDEETMEAIRRGWEQFERGEIYNLEDVIEVV